MEKSDQNREKRAGAVKTFLRAMGVLPPLPPAVKAHRKWDRKNLRTLSCKVSVDEALRFQALCSAYGVTRYAALQEMVRRSLEEADRRIKG